MSDSILTSIKKLLGIDADYHFFDADVIMHINTVFMILYQLGVGPKTPFMIEDALATWSDFMGDATDLAGVKTYIAQKVKLAFDPPQSSAATEALKQNIAELEWRLNVTCDPKETFTATKEEVNAYAIASRAEASAFEDAVSRL